MQKIKALLDKFSERKIVVIGDVMLDRYINGKVERISPEAPVPILKVDSESYAPGGAANVSSNIASLGGKVRLFGIIGNDNSGMILSKMLSEKGVAFFPSFGEKTTEKIRPISDGHQFMRIDYENTEQKKFENAKLEEEIKNSDLIVVSDYAKGVVSKELIEKLKSYGKKILVDPKPQNMAAYSSVDVIKLNESEALKMASVKDVYEAGEKLRKQLNSKIIITRGSKGMLIFEDEVKEIPSVAREVYDVTGAGDTVMAALSLALASGATLEEAATISNYAAGLAVEKVGTTAVKISELKRRVFREESKIKTKEELKQIILEYQKEGKKVVWTNGCFDLLHEGHVRYLKKAAELGDILVIGLNSDSSVRTLKGPTRPLRPQEARAEVLAGLECASYIVIFDETNVSRIFDYLKPDIFVKASDYTLEKMNQDERRIVEANGAKIAFVQIEDDISTTKILETMQKNT